ncbi:MAG: hypothetical protein AB4050_10365 [Synechococcus sp.]
MLGRLLKWGALLLPVGTIALMTPARAGLHQLVTEADINILFQRMNPIQKNSYSSLERKEMNEIILTLIETGIDVYFTDDDLGSLGGFYEPGRGLVVITQLGLSYDTKLTLEVLRHEAFHVVQDCASGQMGGDVAAVGLAIPNYATERFDAVKDGYHNTYTHNLEREAYYVERLPGYATYGLEAICLGRDVTAPDLRNASAPPPRVRNNCGSPYSEAFDRWYPVYVPENRIEEMRLLHCRDAFNESLMVNGRSMVQIAVFATPEGARNFAQQVGGEVGAPVTAQN